MRAGAVTYEAAFSPEDRDVTVIRSIHAGISGPAERLPADSIKAAARALFDAGYLTASQWTESRCGDHWCALSRMT